MLNRPQSLQQYLSTLSPAELAVAKSYLLNIFRANPWLSRFCARGLALLSSNSNQINNLQTRSEFFFNLDSKGSNSMLSNPNNLRLCTHIKVNGIPCGSPALRGEPFCYFHQRMFRGVRTPPQSRLHPVALIESEEGIQASLMEVINALVRNTIDLHRAQLILRALHIAVKNSPHVHFNHSQNQMVSEAPDYPAAPVVPKPVPSAITQAGALARIRLPRPASTVPPKLAARTASPIPANRKPSARVRTAGNFARRSSG
jgi:hypothetical protein